MLNTDKAGMDLIRKHSTGAFTLVEILIVIAIIGILAAIAIPEFQDHSQQAKESAAKENLRVLRNAIELYAAQNGGVPPGYPNNDTTKTPTFIDFLVQVKRFYLSDIPHNPFNDCKDITIITSSPADVKTSISNSSGWLYYPAQKKIFINQTGKDSQGVNYYDY